jgi:hypothetical protein
MDDLLHHGCIGISLTASALSGPARLYGSGRSSSGSPLRGLPLSSIPAQHPVANIQEAFLGEPLWWRALTDNVAQMQAALADVR